MFAAMRHPARSHLWECLEKGLQCREKEEEEVNVKRGEIVVVKMSAITEFHNAYNLNDERNGYYHADIAMYAMDTRNGNEKRHLGNGIASSVSTGLEPTESHASSQLLDLARAMRQSLLNVGIPAYLQAAPGCWEGSADYLSWYLAAERQHQECKAKAAELKAEAKRLLEEAQTLEAT